MLLPSLWTLFKGNEMKFYIIKNKERLESCLSFLKTMNLNNPWSVQIELYKPKRSDAQNRLYWAYVNAIAMQLDFAPETMHWFLKKNFLGYEVQDIMGEKVIVPNSTKKLRVADFIDYLRKIEIFASEKQLNLPNPDDRKYALSQE